MKTPVIDESSLAQIVAALSQSTTVDELRRRFPALHFTLCDDDIPERIKPVADAPGFRIYAITNASGHCISFTPELASATGLVVAQIDDDGD